MNLDKSEKSLTLQTSVSQTKEFDNEIKCTERHIDGEPFAVLLDDSITVPNTIHKQLIDVYNKYQSSAISLEEVSLEKAER